MHWTGSRPCKSSLIPRLGGVLTVVAISALAVGDVAAQSLMAARGTVHDYMSGEKLAGVTVDIFTRDTMDSPWSAEPAGSDTTNADGEYWIILEGPASTNTPRDAALVRIDLAKEGFFSRQAYNSMECEVNVIGTPFCGTQTIWLDMGMNRTKGEIDWDHFDEVHRGIGKKKKTLPGAVAIWGIRPEIFVINDLLVCKQGESVPVCETSGTPIPKRMQRAIKRILKKQLPAYTGGAIKSKKLKLREVPAGIDEDTLLREYRSRRGELTIAIDAVDMRGKGEPLGFRGSAFSRTGRDDVQDGSRCVTGTIGSIVTGGFDTSAYADCRNVADGDIRGCQKVGGVVAQEIFTHELAHALGWEHPNGARKVGNDDTVMSSKCRSPGSDSGGCTKPTETDELTGGLAYRMVPGNNKHDADPEPTHLLLPRCEATNAPRSAVGNELRIFRDWDLSGRRR